jgi:low affinity Fe/Cu permease
MMSRVSDEKNARDPRNGEGSSSLSKPARRDPFGALASWTSKAMGGRTAFVLALLTVIAWALSGPYFQYSENWQLVINTGTTIVTFLMVFLIQNSQNRESKAVHLKLDEIILALKRADNRLINVETLTEEQLDRLGERYREVRQGLADELDQQVAETCNETKRAAQETQPHSEHRPNAEHGNLNRHMESNS